MQLRPFGEHSRLWSLARKARRRGDARAADRWQRLAERELRLIRQSDEVSHNMMLRATSGLKQRHDELQAAIEDATRKLSDARQAVLDCKAPTPAHRCFSAQAG